MSRAVVVNTVPDDGPSGFSVSRPLRACHRCAAQSDAAAWRKI